MCVRRTGECELSKSSWKKPEEYAFAISRKAGASESCVEGEEGKLGLCPSCRARLQTQLSWAK